MRNPVVLAAALCWAVQAAAQAPAPLRVGTKPLPAFVEIDAAGVPHGFSPDLWRGLAKELGRECTWIVYPTVRELLAATERGEVDVAIAGISVTAERERRLDFSQPMYGAGLQILVRAQPSSALTIARDALAMPGLAAAVAAACGVWLAFAHLFWLAERGQPGVARGYLRGVADGAWWAVVTITTVGYGDLVPRTAAGRAVAGLWMLTGLFALAGFVGTVSSTLAVRRLSERIEGPHDLPGHRIATVSDSTAASYLSTRGLPTTERPTIEECRALLARGEVDCAVYDSPVLLHLAQGHAEQLRVVGPLFQREDYALAFPVGSPLRKQVNEALLRLRERGEYHALHARYFGMPER